MRICDLVGDRSGPFPARCTVRGKTGRSNPSQLQSGSGTTVSGTEANKATEVALANYPGDIVDRVVELSNGEYEVHNIGVNWPHHIFVSYDLKSSAPFCRHSEELLLVSKFSPKGNFDLTVCPGRASLCLPLEERERMADTQRVAEKVRSVARMGRPELIPSASTSVPTPAQPKP